MAGSSAYQFGRAAYKAGLVSRRQLAKDAYENLLFSLRGSTDAGTDALRERISQLLEGVRVRDLQRLAPEVLAGVLPRLYPRMLAIAYEHQDAGRPVFICTAASQEMAELMAIVLTFDGAVGSVSEVVDGHYTGRPGGPFTYREGKAQAIRELAEREGIDLERLVGLLGLGVRPADAARRRPPGRRASRQDAGSGRSRGGLGDPALRPPAAAVRGRGGGGRGGRRRRGRHAGAGMSGPRKRGLASSLRERRGEVPHE